MMPLSMSGVGEKCKVLKISGNDETRKFLGSLGFSVGSEITVISKIAGNLIVNVKDSRIAIDNSMANRIMV